MALRWSSQNASIVALLLAGCAVDADDGAPCSEVNEDAAVFLEENRACETEMDCRSADKGCYAGPQVACVEVALASSADPDAWQTHLEALSSACPAQCGGPECGADIQCIDNQCTAVF